VVEKQDGVCFCCDTVTCTLRKVVHKERLLKFFKVMATRLGYMAAKIAPLRIKRTEAAEMRLWRWVASYTLLYRRL